MMKLCNRNSVRSKLLALCMALLMVIVPLMTYVGDENGAKADGNTETTEYYTDSLEYLADKTLTVSDGQDIPAGLAAIFDTNPKTISSPCDNLYVGMNTYSGQITVADNTGEAYDITVSGFKYQYVAASNTPEKNIDASAYNVLNEECKLNATQSMTAVYAKVTYKNTASGNEGTEESDNSEDCYLLVGVYKFENVDMKGIALNWDTGSSENTYNPNSAVLSVTGVDSGKTYAGEWKYAYAKDDNIAPDAASEKWSSDKPQLNSSTVNEDGNYYGYIGYFGKNDSGESVLIKSVTSAAVNLDVTAPSVTKFEIQYKAPDSNDYTALTTADLTDNKFHVGSNDTFRAIVTINDNRDNLADDGIEFIGFETEIFKWSDTQTTLTLTTSDFGADKITGGTLSVKVTDKAGNSSTQTYNLNDIEVTFNKVASPTFEVRSSVIEGANGTGETDISGKTDTIYINKAWLDKNGEPVIKIKMQSDKKLKSDEGPSAIYDYYYDDIEAVAVYNRPYYTSTISKKLGSESVTVQASELKYVAAEGEVSKVEYPEIICDYSDPVISGDVIQSSSDGVTWTNVTVTDKKYVINPNEQTQYRYYFNVADEGGSGLNCDDEGNLITTGSYTQFIKGNGGYYALIDKESLTDTPQEVIVHVSDKAGNISDISLPGVSKPSVTDSIILQVFNGNSPCDIELVDGEKLATNVAYTLKVDITSVSPIHDPELNASVNGNISMFTAKVIKASELNSDKLYNAVYSFDIPKDTDINYLIEGGILNIITDNGTIKTYKIRSIIYDNSKPCITFSDIPAGWVNSYNLSYEVTSGNQTYESNLSMAAYAVSNAANAAANTKDFEQVVSTEDARLSYNATIAVPESATTAGTCISIKAQDEATKYNEETIYIKVDNTRPDIGAIGITGYTNSETPITGAPAITTIVTDNLTLSQAVMTVTYPDGRVEKTNVKDVEENGISRTLSIQLPSGTPDGEYTVSVTATDKAGNSAPELVKKFVIDNTKPVVTAAISSGTIGGKASRADGTDMYYRSDVGVTLTCNDANISNIIVTDNGANVAVNWVDAAGTILISAEGRHIIKINAVDKSGNVADEKQVEFIVDKTAPGISMALNGLPYQESRGVVDCEGSSTVGVTVSDMTEDAADFYYQVVLTRPDQPTMTTEYIRTEQRSFTFSDEGDYTLNFYTIDMANNRSAARSVSFRIDKTAPDIEISGISGGGTSANAATVKFTMREAFWKDAGGVVNIYRKPGDGSEETLYKTVNLTPTAFETTLSENLTETGVYRFEFTATDRIGHKASASQTFTIDRDAPVVTLTGVNNYDITDKTVDMRVEIEDDFYSSKTVSISGTRTDINGKKIALNFAAYNQHSNPTIINESYAEDGVYDITVSATDAAGSSHVSTVHFTVDKTAPVISGLDKLDGAILSAVDLNLDLDDMVTDLTVCDVHMYLNGSEYDGTSNIPDGSYTLLITAEDELGHYSEQSVEFVLDTKAPVFIVTGVEDGETKDADYSIDISLQLDEDILQEVTLNGDAVTITDNTAHIDVTNEGSYTLNMKAYDEAGNESQKTIEFKYGTETNTLLIVIIIIAVILVVCAGIFMLVLAKKRKNDK